MYTHTYSRYTIRYSISRLNKMENHETELKKKKKEGRKGGRKKLDFLPEAFEDTLF